MINFSTKTIYLETGKPVYEVTAIEGSEIIAQCINGDILRAYQGATLNAVDHLSAGLGAETASKMREITGHLWESIWRDVIAAPGEQQPST